MRRTFALVTLVALACCALPADARRHHPQPSPSAAVSPSPLPTPPSEKIRFVQLHRDLISIAQHANGRLGIAVVDQLQFTRFEVDADRPFPLAGVAKLAIALAAFRRADQHKLDLDSRIEIEPGDLRHGVSPIAQNHPHGGASYTFAELVRAMLIESDNTASDRILKELGGPKAVDDFLTNAHVKGFDFRKSEADIFDDAVARRTFATGADNSATPNGVANFLTEIAGAHYLRFDTNTEFLQLLSETKTGDARLRAGLPPGTILAHLSGTSATLGQATDATNDAGIVTLPTGRRVVIVAFLAQSHAALAEREAILASVARAVFHAFAP